MKTQTFRRSLRSGGPHTDDDYAGGARRGLGTGLGTLNGADLLADLLAELVPTATGHTHLLWNGTDRRVMLRTGDDSGSFTVASYGPYTNNAPGNVWYATAVSVGPDNSVHLLWDNTDHRVMLWNVAPDFSFTLAGYGPYTDNGANNLWNATAVSAGP